MSGLRIDSVNIQQVSAQKDDAKLKKTCKDLESVFVNYLLKSMRKTVEKSDLFGSNKEEEYFQDMMDSQVADSISKTSPIGIADMLYNQLQAELETQNLNR